MWDAEHDEGLILPQGIILPCLVNFRFDCLFLFLNGKFGILFLKPVVFYFQKNLNGGEMIGTKTMGEQNI